ncbi:MAG TPA: hypothetical protein VF240_19090 [Pyrinomonadaceae bacterium]
MTTSPRLLVSLSLSLGLGASISAQTPAARTLPAAVTVTAAATDRGVRFTSPSNIVRMQIEVYAEAGPSLFDVSSRGSVFDWALHAGQRLRDSVRHARRAHGDGLS